MLHKYNTFIYGLFNDAVSNLGYIGPKNKTVGDLWIGKDIGETGSGLVNPFRTMNGQTYRSGH
jgi:hypothetical protein